MPTTASATPEISSRDTGSRLTHTACSVRKTGGMPTAHSVACAIDVSESESDMRPNEPIQQTPTAKQLPRNDHACG
eukprot:2714144-Prymnesium_polylepis.1